MAPRDRRGLAGDTDTARTDIAVADDLDSTNCAVLLATAKQMPCAPLMMAVLIPITFG